MYIILQLLKWLLRAWPVIVMLAVIFVHFLLIYYFSLNSKEINKLASLLSQLVGGGFVLYSIDSNIGIFDGKSLFATFSSYLRECPLFKRSVTHQIQPGSITYAGGKVKATVSRNPKSVEEKLEYLQEQINEVKRDLLEESKVLNDKIDRESNKLNYKIQEANLALQKTDSKIKEVAIGGIKIQIFGILLMFYGAVSGFLA